MKKMIVLILTTVVLVSCTQVNSTGEKNIMLGEDTLSEVDISLSKFDAIEELSDIKDEDELIFKASGTEPGWMGEFYNSKIRLILNYGNDSLIIKRDNSDLIKKEDIKIHLQPHNADIMFIRNKPCEAISGDVTERTVSFNCKGKQYKGCGSFKK